MRAVEYTATRPSRRHQCAIRLPIHIELRADGANAGIAALNDEGARLILGDLKERWPSRSSTCRSALENSMRIFRAGVQIHRRTIGERDRASLANVGRVAGKARDLPPDGAGYNSRLNVHAAAARMGGARLSFRSRRDWAPPASRPIPLGLSSGRMIERNHVAVGNRVRDEMLDVDLHCGQRGKLHVRSSRSPYTRGYAQATPSATIESRTRRAIHIAHPKVDEPSEASSRIWRFRPRIRRFAFHRASLGAASRRLPTMVNAHARYFLAVRRETPVARRFLGREPANRCSISVVEIFRQLPSECCKCSSLCATSAARKGPRWKRAEAPKKELRDITVDRHRRLAERMLMQDVIPRKQVRRDFESIRGARRGMSRKNTSWARSGASATLRSAAIKTSQTMPVAVGDIRDELRRTRLTMYEPQSAFSRK